MTDIRTALRLDALATGAVGALLLALGGLLEDRLGLDRTLATAVGAGLLAWAAFVAWVSVERRPALVSEVVAVNLAWVVASLVFAAAWDDLTALGVAVVVAQAVAVVALTALQVASRRHVRTAVPA